MIYTSYFGNKKVLTDGFSKLCPIAICGKSPQWYTGYEYKKLAPKYAFFKVWEETHDNDYYTKCFYDQVLNKLDPNIVYCELMKLSLERTPCLLCYEKPGDFCHRHLVSDWLNQAGISCRELLPGDTILYQ